MTQIQKAPFRDLSLIADRLRHPWVLLCLEVMYWNPTQDKYTTQINHAGAVPIAVEMYYMRFEGFTMKGNDGELMFQTPSRSKVMSRQKVPASET